MRRRLAKTLALIGAALVIGALVTAAIWRFWPRSVPAGQPPLVHVDASAQEVRDAFNAATGSVRVVALLSPT